MRKSPTFLITCCLLVILSLIIFNTQAQTTKNDTASTQTILLQKQEPITLISFKAKAVEGKVYLHWLVKNETESGLFIIERSKNNKDFERVGTKHGVGTLIKDPIAYYYTDHQPNLESYYRIIKVYKSGKYYIGPGTKLEVPLHLALKNQHKQQ
jgi:hypothetical protein